MNYGGQASDECENVVLLQRFMHIVVCQGNIAVYFRMPVHGAFILRQALVNLLSFWFGLKTSQHNRNNVNLPANLM